MKVKKLSLKMKPPRIPKFKVNKVNPMEKFMKKRNKKQNKTSVFGY
jgi:hypothetical protein